MARKQRPLNLYKVIEEALAETAEAPTLRRLIPMAWPIIEVEHHLRVRLEEEMGVIERHLLEALARFGPLTSQELSSLLGLEMFVVDAVIHDLERFPRVMTQKATGYAVPSDTLDRLSRGKWTREVVQPYAFLVNGPTGGLVPLALGKAPRWHWVEVNLAEAGGEVEDYTGKLQRNACWVTPLHSTGQTCLVRALQDTAPKCKADWGIPEGAIEVIEGSGKCLRQRWLLALAEVRDDGAISVRPACRPDLELLSVDVAHAEKFAEQIRRGKHSAYGLFQPDASGLVAQDIPPAWKPHLEYEGKNGTLLVSLPHPAKVPLWFGKRDAEESDDDWQEEGEASRVPSEEFPAQLRDMLSFPHWWHPFSFAVRHIEPRDDKTAELLLLLAGLRRLTHLASDGVDSTFDLPTWWSETQNRISEAWKSDSGKARVRFDTMLAAARRSPDGDVVDFISEFS
jgi:hypothetical protein